MANGIDSSQRYRVAPRTHDGASSGERSGTPRVESGAVVNDVHSRLNETEVHRITRPVSAVDIQAAVRAAGDEGRAISVAGGRHAMGGQQFGTGTVHLDMRTMNRVLAFDRERGVIEVEAGIQWPELISYLIAEQRGQAVQWGIAQKQTGADRLSIGGALASNVHGRGLTFGPIIGDVDSFTLVDANGDVRHCDRTRNPELFRLAIGGYGLFGVIATVRLRLIYRRQVERVVDVIDVQDLMSAFEDRIANGFLYGDFQFAIDPAGVDFLRRGVFSCYRPCDDVRPIPSEQHGLSSDDWMRLLHLAHTDKRRAVDAYVAHYQTTNGQVYWSDTHQMADYIDDYHHVIDRQLGLDHAGSEIITELYVPRDALSAFLDDVRADFLSHDVDVIYGTIRLIERDDESFLAWARESSACVIFNLHSPHTREGEARSAESFRRLIDAAIRFGGSYYLTYHRYASREQVEACYPRFREFLELKRRYDPEDRFQSDWYRHYRDLFAAGSMISGTGR